MSQDLSIMSQAFSLSDTCRAVSTDTDSTVISRIHCTHLHFTLHKTVPLSRFSRRGCKRKVDTAAETSYADLLKHASEAAAVGLEKAEAKLQRGRRGIP